MKILWKWIMIPAVSLMFFGAACGGGGGGDSTSDSSSASAVGDALSHYNAGIEKLKAGDVAGAHVEFTAAIASAPAGAAASVSDKDLTEAEAVTKSHIGNAITGLLLIQESQQVTDILDGFGQSAWYLNTIFGSTGYLAQQYANYGAQAIDLHATGSATVDMTRPLAVSRSDLDQQGVYRGQRVAFASYDYFGDTPAEVFAVFYSSIDPLTGTVDAPCAYGAGVVITPATTCTIKDGGNVLDNVRILSNFAVNGFQLDPAKSTGSVTIDSIGTNPGETISLTFSDLTLFDINGGMITLNGTLTDTLSEGRQPTYDGFPFRYCTYKTGVKCAMGAVMSGYRSGAAVASLDGIGAELDLIIDDLASAATDASATFDVPKEFLFSDRDLHINHTDLMAMQASGLFARSAIHMLNSWTMDMDLSGFYDAQGVFIGNNSQIVHELNQFFHLRDDNQLSDARDRLASGFAAAAQALTEANSDSTGTVLVVNAANAQLYSEIASMLSSGAATMNGSTPISGVDPQIAVDLSGVFEAKVNGADIQSDPFVLENGHIKPVESYFASLMQNVCNYDLGTHPQAKAFSDAIRALSHSWVRLAFPQFMRTQVGGLPYRRYVY